MLLTPITNIGVWSFDGADNTTFLAPASRCLPAVSSVKKKPVDSITYSAPTSSHFKFAGSLSAVILIRLPLTSNFPSLTSTSPSNCP